MISFNMFLVVFVFVFFNLSSMSAIATSGAVDEFVRVRDEFPFIVNDPIVFVFILYGFIFCRFFVPFLYSVLLVYGAFMNDASSNSTMMSSGFICAFSKFFLEFFLRLLVF